MLHFWPGCDGFLACWGSSMASEAVVQHFDALLGEALLLFTKAHSFLISLTLMQLYLL
jgi:hypothetical protein